MSSFHSIMPWAIVSTTLRCLCIIACKIRLNLQKQRISHYSHFETSELQQRNELWTEFCAHYKALRNTAVIKILKASFAKTMCEHSAENWLFRRNRQVSSLTVLDCWSQFYSYRNRLLLQTTVGTKKLPIWLKALREENRVVCSFPEIWTQVKSNFIRVNVQCSNNPNSWQKKQV